MARVSTRRAVAAAWLLGLAALCLLAVPQSHAQTWVTYKGDYRTLLVSAGGSGSERPAMSAGSSEPSISLDGRNIGFVSASGPRGSEQVFLRTYRERCTAATCACCTTFTAGATRTFLVSRAEGVRGAAAEGGAGEPAVSGSGLKVAFASSAGNLGGRPGVRGVYLRDVRRGRTILVSRANGPHGAAANAESLAPSISSDGRFVAFASRATNLGGPKDGRLAVYVRDLRRERTILISRASGGAPANADAGEPSLAPGGDAVAFVSAATNLGALAPAGVSEVYERGLHGGPTVLVSQGPGGGPANADAAHPSVDQRGSRVAFQSAATNLGAAEPFQNVYLRDLGRGKTWLMSRGFKHHMVPGPPGNADSTLPSLSRDGRFVCFQSAATNFGSPYDGYADSRVENVFVHDTRSRGTFLISRGPGKDGAGANGNSSHVSCSAGASLAAFQSTASNLSAAAPAGVANVYRRTIFGGK